MGTVEPSIHQETEKLIELLGLASYRGSTYPCSTVVILFHDLHNST